MDNDKKKTQNENFEQEFMATVQKSTEKEVSLAKKKKDTKRLWSILGIIVAFILILAIVIASIVSIANQPSSDIIIEDEDSNNDFFDAETSMVEILVAPNTAKVIIGEEQYTNGTYEVAPGEYKVSIEENGFEPYAGTIIVSDKHKTYLTTCLQPTQGNEEYYNNNPEQYLLCQTSEEIADAAAWDQNALTDKIFDYTPFHDDEEGFYVDPYYNDNNELIVEITLKDCSQAEATLEEKAYNWIREQGLDPTKYTFEKTWDCEE